MRVDVVLQSPDADVPQAAARLVVDLVVHLEADGIEQFQQSGETDGLAVMRGCRSEQPMLEQEADLAQHPGSLAGPASAGRREVVAFIDDQQIPRCVSQYLPVAILAADLRRLQELLQNIRQTQVVHRRDDAREGFPRVRVDPHAAAELERRIRVDDLEIQVEFSSEFDLPLPLKHGGTEDQHAANPATEQKFFQDQPRLDGLSEPDAIGQQQADSQHAQGTDHRLELVRMNLDRRVPDAQQGLVPDVVRLAQTVQPRPAMGVDERSQRRGMVRVVRIDAGQRRRAQDLRRRFDFPQHLLGFRIAAVIQILDLDDVQASLLTASVVGLDGAHRRQPVANLHRLTDFGDTGRFAAHRITPPRRLDDTRFIQVGAFHALLGGSVFHRAHQAIEQVVQMNE
jgi:hypothetical protein